RAAHSAVCVRRAAGCVGLSRADAWFDGAARRRPVHGETKSKLDGKAAASRENSSGDPPGFHLAGGSAAAPGQTTCLAEKAAWRFTNAQSLERWIGTIAQMAHAAKERSYEYIGITDHSKTLKIAGGIDERALKAQGAEITEVNVAIRKSGLDLTVLRSIEMNLNPRGEGDMSPESLVNLDL